MKKEEEVVLCDEKIFQNNITFSCCMNKMLMYTLHVSISAW
jgi:hypothetical protein